MARRQTRPTPEPLDVDAVSVVTVGTLLWGVAALALAAFARDWLERNNDTWWIWTCVSGFVLGLAGIAYVRRRRNKIGRIAAARAEQPPVAPSPGSPASVVDPAGPVPGGDLTKPARGSEPA
jgi:hypothetical protein